MVRHRADPERGFNLVVSLVRAAQRLPGKMQVIDTNPNVRRTFPFTRLDQPIELLTA